MNINQQRVIREMAQKEREIALREQDEALSLEAAEKERIERARFEAAMRSNGLLGGRNSKRNFYDEVTSYVTEAVFSCIFDKCFKDADEDTCAFNKSILHDFIEKEGGAAHLLNDIESKSLFLSETALNIRQIVKSIMENVDPEDKTTELVDQDSVKDVIDSIDGSEEIEDVTDEIRMRVSRATEEFVEKNMMDKINIKDTLLTTEEKLKNVKSGDDATDEQIKMEQVMASKRAVSNVYRRPHTVYEKLFINLAEACLTNEQLKAQYVLEDGKLDMPAIQNKATSIYTFMEFVNYLKIKPLTEEFIIDTITIK